MSERACRGCRRHLSAFLDGELTGRLERRVRLHLEDCLTCRDHFEELRTVARETSRLGATPPEDLEAGILRGLEAGLRDGEGRGSRTWRSPLLVGASAVVLAAVVGLGVIGLGDLAPFGARRSSRQAEAPPRAEKTGDAQEEGRVSDSLDTSGEITEPLADPDPAEKLRLAESAVRAVEKPENGAAPAPSGKAGLQPTVLGQAGGARPAEQVAAAREREADEETAPSALLPSAPVEAEPADRRERNGKKGETYGFATAKRGEAFIPAGCAGPPVAAPGPGEILGCAGESAEGFAVRVVLDAEAPALVPGPLPVPEAAASAAVALLLELRLAPDGRVLSAEAVPPAEEGSIEAAVCEAVTRWRFLPALGAEEPEERRVRLSLRLEPASR